MSDQMELGVDAATGRRFSCCGMPAPPLSENPPHLEHPHAEDCPNPSLGVFFDRWGRQIRSLWCGDGSRLGGPCPYGGSYPQSERIHDPYNGLCCKEIPR